MSIFKHLPLLVAMFGMSLTGCSTMSDDDENQQAPQELVDKNGEALENLDYAAQVTMGQSAIGLYPRLKYVMSTIHPGFRVETDVFYSYEFTGYFTTKNILKEFDKTYVTVRFDIDDEMPLINETAVVFEYDVENTDTETLKTQVTDNIKQICLLLNVACTESVVAND